MLIKKAVLDGIAAGRLDLAFRTWERARVKKGSRLRTPVGVVEVDDVSIVSIAKLTKRDASRAGFDSLEELVAAVGSEREGRVHRIRLHLAGPDPRIALRAKSELTVDELDELRDRLRRLDARGGRGPWTTRVLELIRSRPGVRAGELASRLGRDRLRFKADVRKLKELGLTESLEIGYRLSPRGEALLRAGR